MRSYIINVYIIISVHVDNINKDYLQTSVDYPKYIKSLVAVYCSFTLKTDIIYKLL